MTSRFAYQGKYKGFTWSDLREELSFALSDLEHAYVELLDAPLTTAGQSDARTKMDEAMDRVSRAIERSK